MTEDAPRPGISVDQVIGWSAVAVFLAVVPAGLGLVVLIGMLLHGGPADPLAELGSVVALAAAVPSCAALVLVATGVRSWRRARRAQGMACPESPRAAGFLVTAAALAAVPWLLLFLGVVVL